MEEARHTTDNQLNCPICLTTYESPKVLACLHTFCEKCIYKHVQAMRTEGTQSDTIACPVCRSYTPAPVIAQTPDDWAAKLPTNSTVLTLISLGLPGRDGPIYCQPCLKNGKHHVSVAYCVTCSEYLCHTCYNCHKSFKMTSDHTFTVNALPENPNASVATESIYRCSSHNKRFTYFCLHHKELCCHKCATSVHKPCMELSTVEVLAKDMKDREDSKQISDNLEALKELFHILLENNLKCLESIQNQKTEIIKSIQQWKIAMNGHIEKLEADLLHELDQVCKQETIVVSDHIAECKSTIAAIETSQRMLHDGNQCIDDAKVFMTTTRISKHAQKYLQRYEFLENDSEEVQIEFQCDKAPEDFVRTWSSIGKVKSKKCRVSKLSSGSSFELTSFSAKVPGDAKVCDILSGVFLPDEKLVLSDVKNKKLKLFDKKSNCLNQLEMAAAPRYICRVDHRTVAVTAGESVTVFSVSHTLTRLRTIDVGHECYGIASYQENIIVDQLEDNELLVTLDTSYKATNTIQLVESLYRTNTHCISPDGKKIHYTADDKILTVNMNGEKLNTFKSDDLKYARGITVDKKGIIYCCGNKSNTVVQVTPEGKQLGVLLSQDCGFVSPTGICLNDKNNKILVFERQSDFVKVFRVK